MGATRSTDRTEPLSVALPADLRRAVDERVRGGRYASADALIAEALRGWLVHERRLQGLDAAIERGLGDLDAGRARPVAAIRAQMRRRLAGVAEAEQL